ncbi:MAG TPA: hypothetical protein VIX17_19505 [Pyrinomonadaceae bacterium]|jgi:hypothetical protein
MNKYLLLGGAGAAVGLTYALRGKSSKRRQSQSNSNSAGRNTNDATAPLDDAGTTNEMAVQTIRALRDNAFEGSDEKLAMALGRPATEVRAWFDGSLPVDSDGLIKARGLAEERNTDIPR